jgi:hypothetical protein
MAGRLISFILILGIAFQLNAAAQAAQVQDTTDVAKPHVPRLITVNGVLLDRDRHPLTGVVGVTLSLYRDQVGGAPVWLESQNVQLDANGGYTLLLGAATADGLPMDLFTGGDPRWLGVRPQVFLADEQPRVLLVSVPYALKAGDADTIGGLPASAFVQVPQPTTTVDATTTATPTKVTSKMTGSNGPTVNALSGTCGTVNSFAKWVLADTAGCSFMTESADGLTLGFGTGGLARIAVNGGSGAGLWLRYADANMYIDSDAGILFRINGPAGLPEAMRITNTGAVGIGTSAPAGKLDVRGPVSFGSSATGTRINATGSVNAGIWLRYLDQNMYVDSDSNMIFRVNGNAGLPEAMRITTGGNIGVGTAAPSTKFEVAGNLKISNAGALVFSDATTLSSANPVAAAAVRGITYLAGCDTCSTLQDTDSQKNIYVNLVGAMTVQDVKCFVTAGSPTVNIQKDNNGSPFDILSGPISCNATGGTFPGLAQNGGSIGPLEKLHFHMVSAGGATSLTVVIKTTVN